MPVEGCSPQFDRLSSRSPFRLGLGVEGGRAPSRRSPSYANAPRAAPLAQSPMPAPSAAPEPRGGDGDA